MSPAHPRTESDSASVASAGKLGLWDTVGIIVGIVVGTAIFSAPPLVFQNVSSGWQAIGVWLAGGIISLLGAFCYAELATTYPKSGGDYQYLTRAFGKTTGFLFGWAQLCVILTGSIGCMAFAFADYTVGLGNWERDTTVQLAAIAVTVLTGINLLGLMAGKWTQNLLTLTKAAGLMLIVVAGVCCGQHNPGTIAESAVNTGAAGVGGLGLALVFVLYAYGGWNDAAFVTAEVRNIQRNIPLSLILGVSLITVIYVLINGTFLWLLGIEGARQTWTPAADVLGGVFGPTAAKCITVLIMISALGAINGLIFTGSRLFVSLGEDHRVFALLSGWHPRLNVPAVALLAQAMIAILLMLIVGTSSGQNTVDHLLGWIGIHSLPWEQYHGGFETLIAGTAPVFWAFFLLTGISVFVLRVKDRDRTRPFKTPLYPIPPLIFCASCLYMLYASAKYAQALCLIGIVPVLLGLPIYWFSSRQRRELRDPVADKKMQANPAT